MVVWTPERKILFVFDFIHFVLSNTVITSVLTLSWEPTWNASFSSVSFHWQFELRFTVNITKSSQHWQQLTLSLIWPKVLLRFFKLIIAKSLQEKATKKNKDFKDRIIIFRHYTQFLLVRNSVKFYLVGFLRFSLFF